MTFYTANSLTEKIITSTSKSKMIIIGENPHNNQAINDLVVNLSIELARKTEFRTYAKESLYCLHPFMEAASQSGKESRNISPKITEYNKNAEPGKRITLTAVDLAHSIKHSPHLAGSFIQHHISDLKNAGLKDEITRLSMNFQESADKKTVDHTLRELQQILKDNKDEFNSSIHEELTFYTELLQISLQLNDPGDRTKADTRNEWFRKTMDRAIERNKNHGKVLFHVGAAHAIKFYLNQEDYYVGEIPEAGYYKEKAYIIHIRPFYLGPFGKPIEKIEDPIEKKALACLGNEKSVFVDLREYRDQEDNTGIEKYYSNGEYQIDGILYVDDRKEK